MTPSVVCYIFVNSPPFLDSLFPFCAPLTPSMCSNHHLGKPDKLRGRHQHLGVELKSCLETAGRLTRPMHSFPSMEVRKWHTVHSLPVCFSLSSLCLFIYIFVSPSFIHPLFPLRETVSLHPIEREVKRFRLDIFVKGTCMCHPAGVRDYPPSDSLCPPNLRNCLY